MTTLKIGSKERRVSAFYFPRFKVNLIKYDKCLIVIVERENIRWPVRDIAIFFFLKLSRDNSNLSRDNFDKMNSYRAIDEKI